MMVLSPLSLMPMLAGMTVYSPCGDCVMSSETILRISLWTRTSVSWLRYCMSEVIAICDWEFMSTRTRLDWKSLY